MNENLNLLIEKDQSELTIENEVMQNVLASERTNVNVRMQNDDYMILPASPILISELRNQSQRLTFKVILPSLNSDC